MPSILPAPRDATRVSAPCTLAAYRFGVRGCRARYEASSAYGLTLKYLNPVSTARLTMAASGPETFCESVSADLAVS